MLINYCKHFKKIKNYSRYSKKKKDSELSLVKNLLINLKNASYYIILYLSQVYKTIIRFKYFQEFLPILAVFNNCNVICINIFI